MLASFIGLRYLRSKKSNAFLSLITFLSIAGVMVGVATLIVTLSVMDGFEGALKGRLAQGDFHILVQKSAQNEQDPYFEWQPEKIDRIFQLNPDIQQVNPVLVTEAILRAGKKVSGMSMRGVTEPQMNFLARSLVESVEGPKIISPDGLWLGKELAYQLAVLPGDKVQVISPLETEGPLEAVPKMRVFKVEGIFESGIPEKDLQTVYAPLLAVQQFLGHPEKINRLEVSVEHFQESAPSAAAIRKELGDAFLVKDWDELNASLFASLKLERITMFTILTMIILVASFNIVTSLKMTVIEKKKEIAILKAMGARESQIRSVFLFQGLVIGNVGTALGLFLGLGLAFLLKRYPLIELPDVFFDRTLPVKLNPLLIFVVVATATLMVLAAAYFPARSAAKDSPLAGIRH